MANSIQGSGNNVITINNLRVTADFTTNLSPSGNGIIAESYFIQTGSYQLITSGSIPDVGTIYVDNTAGPGTVVIATDSVGTNKLGTLQPLKWTNTSWTGSVALYGKALDSGSFINLIVASN